MEQAQRDFAVNVVQQLRDAGFTALWAGGCVRDLFMGKSPKDYDVATNATPSQVIELFGRKNTVAVGEAFGVIIIIAPIHQHNVEVATFRNDGNYSDGRRPDHVVFSKPEEDAKRRDFTINGMFFDPVDETLHDFVGGEIDLKAGLIRAIGNPHERFREDKLRMLRAIRFASRFHYIIEPLTALAIKEHAADLRQVSRERITDEMSKMLAHYTRGNAMLMTNEHKLLQFVFHNQPLIENDKEGITRYKTLTEHLPNGHLMLAWTILLNHIIEVPPTVSLEEFTVNFCHDFKFSNDQAAEILWLWKNRNALDKGKNCTLAELKTVLAHKHAPELIKWMELRSYNNELSSDNVNYCREFLTKTPHEILDPPPLVTGNDLINRGIKPGPAFKELLQKVRTAQLNEHINTHDEGINMINSLRQ